MKKAVQILLLSALFITFTVTKQVNAMQGTKEIWIDVVGYEGLYKISNCGSVKNQDGSIKIQHQRKGYFSVNLYRNAKFKNKTVHRLVAIAFIPNPNNYPQVNHIDGDKLNNQHSNLEWCTPKQNTNHAINNNLRRQAVGESYRHSKLNDNKVRKIRLMSKYMTHQAIADKFNVRQSCITRVINGQNWKHVV